LRRSAGPVPVNEVTLGTRATASLRGAGSRAAIQDAHLQSNQGSMLAFERREVMTWKRYYRRWTMVAALAILTSASAGLSGCYGLHPYAHHRYENSCGTHSQRCDRPDHHRGRRQHRGGHHRGR